jgi:dienelactone hydrolase
MVVRREEEIRSRGHWGIENRMNPQGRGLGPQEVTIPLGRTTLYGTLGMPLRPAGIVLFAHGSGSSRLSPRNRLVADVLQRAGLATLLFDLLTAEEERVDERTMHLRFDIGLLAERLVGATDWVGMHPDLRALPIGYFGASTGAAAALVAAARRPNRVAAVVSRGGRPDLARSVLTQVRASTLLIVGGRDTPVIGMNEDAMAQMLHARVQTEIVPGATHLFEEPGALEKVAELARDWFVRFLVPVEVGTVPA